MKKIMILGAILAAFVVSGCGENSIYWYENYKCDHKVVNADLDAKYNPWLGQCEYTKKK